MKTRLGKQETQFLAYLQIRKKRIVRTDELTGPVKIALQYGDKGTIRRMGLLLEREGIETKLLRKLEQVLKPSKGLIPFIPGRPKRGTAIPRWGVVNNEET